jgi:ECF transporter S component (folate family)
MKNKLQVMQLTTATMLTTVGVILGNFSIILPVFSIPALRLDIVAIPIILSGLILGKWYGMGVGIIIDIINFLLYGQGAYHVGFTINNALIGLFSGMIPLFFQQKNFPFVKKTLIITSTLLILITVGILYSLDRLSLGGETVALTLEVRIAIISLIIVMSLLTIGFMYLTLRDYKYELKDMYTVSIMIILIEFFVVILLTPLWIQDLFGQPYIIGFLARIIRGSLLIPFKIIIVLAIINVIKKQQVTTLRGFIEN